MLVVVEVVRVVLVEEATVKEGVAVVVKGVAVHQEALHQGLLEGKALTRVAHLAVVQVDQLVQEGQEEGQAGEVLQVEDEEEAQVGDLAGGKVPAIVEAPLQVNQAMDQPAVEEETLETTPSATTTALPLGRSSLVTEPLAVTEVSLPSTATTGRAGSSEKLTFSRSFRTLRLKQGRRFLLKKGNISKGEGENPFAWSSPSS